MAELFPLAHLWGPVAFLTGARIPLHDPRSTPMRWEWCGDTCLLELVSDRAWGACDLPADLALDLTNEDIARWVDRKIAEALSIPPEQAAFARLTFDAITQTYRIESFDGLQRLNERAITALGTGPLTANIPTARAALLRALFGREK